MMNQRQDARKRPYRRPIRILLIALALGLALVVGTARAATPNPLCLLIQTLGPDGYLNDAFLNVQTHQVSVINPTPATPDPSVTESYNDDYAYSPDGLHLVQIHQAHEDDLGNVTIKTFAQPQNVLEHWPYYQPLDAEPPIRFNWSPDNRRVAVMTTTSFVLLDVSGKRLQNTPRNGLYVEWPGDSSYVLVYSLDSPSGSEVCSATLHHLPDWRVVALRLPVSDGSCGYFPINGENASPSGACFNYYCWANGARGYRRAYILPKADPSGADTLILLDASVPSQKTIALPATSFVQVGIAPNGKYVFVIYTYPGQNTSEMRLYHFNGTLIDFQADNLTNYEDAFGMNYEIGWSTDSETLYYMRYPENGTRTQLWSYQFATAQKRKLADWPTALLPWDPFKFNTIRISHDNQRIMVSANNYFLSTPELVLPGGKLVTLPANSRSSDWSPDDRYIAIGTGTDSKIDYRHTLLVTLLDPNGNRITDTTLQYEDDQAHFTLTWTTCPR